MIPEIRNIRIGLANLEPLIEEIFNELLEAKSKYLMLLTSYSSLLIERDNLKKELEQMKNDKCNIDNKKSKK